MGDRIFSLVNALLCNQYVIRVQRPGEGLHEYDITDYECSDEAEVQACFNRAMSVHFPTLWVFRAKDWHYDATAEAVAMLDLATVEDRVVHHREYEVDEFITNRVKETQ